MNAKCWQPDRQEVIIIYFQTFFSEWSSSFMTKLKIFTKAAHPDEWSPTEDCCCW